MCFFSDGPQPPLRPCRLCATSSRACAAGQPTPSRAWVGPCTQPAALQQDTEHTEPGRTWRWDQTVSTCSLWRITITWSVRSHIPHLQLARNMKYSTSWGVLHTLHCEVIHFKKKTKTLNLRLLESEDLNEIESKSTPHCTSRILKVTVPDVFTHKAYWSNYESK